ncbi:hypothetical protein BASA81_014620 [Batrachochytrium salamandrivorans]|nr:hypothetical protein BASA81_014620 [Batrachochytrium salamandrivorans]
MTLPFESQFYSGTKLRIKDHLVHCESPVSLAAAMDQAFVLITGFLSGDRRQQYNPRQFRRNPPPNTPVSRIQPQQYQQRFVDNYSRSPANQPSAPITSTPVQQRPTSNDMDIDFARRGPSNYF